MLRLVLLLAPAVCSFAAASIVAEVRSAISGGDFVRAERLATEYRQRAGHTPEALEALSWLGRGALAVRKLDDAERYAAETRRLSLDLLQSRKLDDERRLPVALGASIEVHAQTLAARGQRTEAVEFLNTELARWSATSMHERIRKNLNLLTLAGKGAPPLVADRWLGSQPPASWKGRPLLLFLWAHWCGDCKGMAPALAAIQKKYAARGLAIVAPTKLYGYALRGENATPEEETRHIEQVRQQFYGAVANMPAPLGASIFQTYGVSTTPTLVLVDRGGTVRLYHPGAMRQAELEAKIDAMLSPVP